MVTCLGSRGVLPTQEDSAVAGGGRPECAGVSGGSRALGSAPRDPPELSGYLERRFGDRRSKRLKWVQVALPEVGRAVCRPLARVAASGGLLKVR